MGTPVSGGEVTVTLTEFTIEASATDFTVGQEPTPSPSPTSASSRTSSTSSRRRRTAQPLEANGEEAEIEPIDPGTSGT